jgi:hypothetical protein
MSLYPSNINLENQDIQRLFVTCVFASEPYCYDYFVRITLLLPCLTALPLCTTSLLYLAALPLCTTSLLYLAPLPHRTTFKEYIYLSESLSASTSLIHTHSHSPSLLSHSSLFYTSFLFIFYFSYFFFLLFFFYFFLLLYLIFFTECV